MYRQIFSLLRPYRRLVLLNVLSNLLMVVFNVVSIPMLIPFLQILLGKEIAPIQKPDFQWNMTALTQRFYYEMGQIVAQTGSKEQALIFVCFFLVGVFFFKNLFHYLALFVLTPVRNGVVRDMRQKMYDKTLRLPLSYFSDERKGDLMSRVTTDVLEVEWSVISILETLVREPLMVLGSLVLMVIISYKLLLFVLLLLLVMGLIVGGLGSSLRRESAAAQAKMGNLSSVLDETLGGVRVIKAFSAEKYQRDKFSFENNAYRRLMNRALRRRDLASPLTEFMGIGIVCVLVWFGFKQVENQQLTAESFIAFLYAFFTIITPAKSFSVAFAQLQRGRAALDRINQILDAPDVIVDVANQNADPLSISSTFTDKKVVFKEKITFQNVSFFYKEGENQILKNINFTLEKGKVVALVGASGAGKSTIADLLPRFYDPTDGAILFDDTNIKDLTIKELRALMGIVTQEAILFNDTIFNNIVFGLPDVTLAQVEAAARAANAHDFIKNTEGGYQTNIGDRGMKLSGGQRQRLTIARALLRNPEILILDEATSALDSESEKLVQMALTELMKNRTALVIAHRLSTVQHADEILVLHEGEIVERGKHADLLAQNGAYRRLVQLQGLT